MQHYESLDRTESLMRLIPNLFDMECLYIGGRDDRMDYFHDFKKQPTILEVYTPNVADLEALGYSVLHYDVRYLDLEKILLTGKYEVVFWWHGPEHIRKNELQSTLYNLEKIASKYVVLGCPWGKFEQGAIYGNPYEKHVAAYGHKSFEKYGYRVECLGTKNKRGSNITAVKWL